MYTARHFRDRSARKKTDFHNVAEYCPKCASNAIQQIFWRTITDILAKFVYIKHFQYL